MRNRDGVFTTHRVIVALPGQLTPIIIQPVGDIHETSATHDKERYSEFVKLCKKTETKYTYYLFMGDEHDFVAWSEREKIKNANLHDSTAETLDELAYKQCQKTADEWDFARGRILGFIQGNHYWQFIEDDPTGEIRWKAGKTSTELLCDMLGCKWLGAVTYVRMSVRFGNTAKHISIDIAATHGSKAGGKLLGTSINQIEDLKTVFPVADIYLMAHNHQCGAVPSSCMIACSGCNGLSVREKRQWFGRTGSFLKGYVQNKSSYIVNRLTRPTALGTIQFRVEFRQHKGRETSESPLLSTLYADVHCLM